MTPARHALLVGVSYSRWMLENRDRCPGYQRLESCAADVDLMRAALTENFGFTEDGVRVLIDRDATQAAILDALDDVAGRATGGDIVFFYFAGHGSGMRDPRDPARKLATVAPFDTGRRPAPNRDVPNLVFDRWVRRLNEKTPNVTLIFDCCHSAELGRDPFSRPARGALHDPRPLAELYAGGELPDFLAGACERPPEPMLRSGWLPAGRRAVVVGACRAGELSWEIRRERGLDTFHYGPLTYHLAQAFTALGPGATWRDVLERVAPRVLAEQTSPKRRQHPQIEGDIDRVVYGLEQARAAAYLPVVKVDGDSTSGGQGVELWGGAAHDVRSGSLWSIRPHGARSREAASEVARVKVDAVRPATCRGTLEGTPAMPLEAGQRAFLLEYNLEQPGLTVAIEAGDRGQEIAARIRQSELLAVASDPQSAGVLVRCLEPRPDAGPDDPCPFLGAVAERTWALVGPEGDLQAKPRPDAPGATGRLVADLEKLARCSGLRTLGEPADPESPLFGKVGFRILDRHGAELAAGDAGEPVIAEGESADFEIANRHDAEVWVSLVELASDNSITVLAPNRAHPGFRRGGYRLHPGQTLRVGRDYWGVEAGLEQVLPEGFPWAAERAGDVAIACLKLLVTTAPADFEFLEQERTRIVPTHPLRKLALLYHSGTGTRRVILAADDLDKDQAWTVITRELGVRRASG